MYVTQCVRNGGVGNEVYVRCLTNQSAAIAYVQCVRHGVYVRCSTNQSAAIAYAQGVRHGVYVRCLTNQNAAIAYVTLHTSRNSTNPSAVFSHTN